MIQGQTIQVMHGADGKTHLLTWTGKGVFKPYCCAVRKCPAVKIKSHDADDVELSCNTCETQRIFLVNFWHRVAREQERRELP